MRERKNLYLNNLIGYRMDTQWKIVVAIIALILIGIITATLYGINRREDIAKETANIISASDMIAKYDAMAGRQIGVDASGLADDERCMINYQALATRFTGFIGPYDNAVFNPAEAASFALKAGCRTFILEIDYRDDDYDKEGNKRYFPRLMVRDVKGRNRVDPATDLVSQTVRTSNIKEACQAIVDKAFAAGQGNREAPVILVLYVLRMPPSDHQLEYMANIARCMSPIIPRHLTSITAGGVYTRHSQEAALMKVNDIAAYNGNILVFCNADTSAFTRPDAAGKYKPAEDLDYLVHLRLGHDMATLGATAAADQTAGVAVLEAAGEFLNIPAANKGSKQEIQKEKWTVSLADNPIVPVDVDTYNVLSGSYGVQCVPIVLWDKRSNYMFDANRFKTASFIPRPAGKRFKKPGIAEAGQANPRQNAAGGALRNPGI
jgi:hypothetical protein